MKTLVSWLVPFSNFCRPNCILREILMKKHIPECINSPLMQWFIHRTSRPACIKIVRFGRVKFCLCCVYTFTSIFEFSNNFSILLSCDFCSSFIRVHSGHSFKLCQYLTCSTIKINL